ncbi:seryl-tRNA synthetase [Coemansia sp. RSA 1804]|nr:seryl-tRNA synthetase [Coemansia sp. RSA 1804]
MLGSRSAHRMLRQRCQRQADIAWQTRRTLKQPAFDYRHIRDNAASVQANAERRNVRDARAHRVAQLYDEFCALTAAANDKRSRLNSASRELAASKSESKSGPGSEAMKRQARALREAVRDADAAVAQVQAALEREAARLPNSTHGATPEGDESQARVVRTHGTLHTIDRVPEDGVDQRHLSQKPFADHADLAARLGLVDLAAGAAVAGARFHYWRGAGALLELALVQYAMTRAVGAGFVPHVTPDVARASVVAACGFRPREDTTSGSNGGNGSACQTYRVEHESHAASSSDDPLCLVATAEIPLVAMHAGSVVDGARLPMSLAGVSHCFRAEAGARGRDTRGVYRVHQFTKVELVTLAHPDRSDHELTRLVDFQASLYADLGLTFRVLLMPTHELGAAAFQKFDIEAWMPGRRRWGEISSASNCTDYQARRLHIRARIGNTAAAGSGSGSSSPVFVHTLNATAAAVPRLVVAILESFQRPDGTVVVPPVLRPWMMGIDVLEPPS